MLDLIFLSNPELVFYRIITKPLLVSLLLLYFLLNETETKTKILISLALLFSVLGDVLLLFTDWSENYFIFGLLAFLTTHILYSIQFSRERNKNIPIFKPMVFLLIIGAFVFYFLKNSLGNLLVPVLVYIIVILTMVLFAYLRRGKVSKKSADLVFTGAVLFLISDAVLAIDKFYIAIPFSSILIMITYAFAQLFIVLGILEEEKSNFRI